MTHIVWYLCGLFRLSKSSESAGRKVAFPPGNMKRLRIFIGAHRGTISQSQTAHLKELGQFEFTHSDNPLPLSRDGLALQEGKTEIMCCIVFNRIYILWVVTDLMFYKVPTMSLFWVNNKQACSFISSLYLHKK